MALQGAIPYLGCDLAGKTQELMKAGVLCGADEPAGCALSKGARLFSGFGWRDQRSISLSSFCSWANTPL